MKSQPDQDQPARERDISNARTAVRGVIVGGAVLLAIMLSVAGGAIAFGWLSNGSDGSFDLRRWLLLELIIGSIASAAGGYVCRRISGRILGPAILAVLVFCIGLFEASAILSYSEKSESSLTSVLAMLAPFVSSLGVLIGGWRPQWRRIKRLRRFGEVRLKGAIHFAVPASILVSAALLTVFALPKLSNEGGAYITASALTLDFVVTLPAMAYLLLVRTRRLPLIALFPIFAVGYALALATIPTEHSAIHQALKWLVIPVELLFVGYLITLARKMLRETGATDADFASRFRSIARGVLAKRIPADILTTEIAILYYAFRRRTANRDETVAFTVYKEVGYLTVLVTLLTLFLIEIVALHYILISSHPTLAWILTGLSIYGLVWVVGDYRAMGARPIRVTEQYLQLRVGVRWEADIAFDQIALVESNMRMNESLGRGAAKLGMLSQSNLHLTLKEPVEIIGMYGLRKVSQDIWLQVDRANELCRLVQSKIQRQ